MSRLIYVDADDEITDLVQRLRAASEEDVAFVVPASARALHNQLDLRMLSRYAHQMGKRCALVSGESRVQDLARSAGLGSYASPQAFEQGVQTSPRRPHAAPADIDQTLPATRSEVPPRIEPAPRVDPVPPTVAGGLAAASARSTVDAGAPGASGAAAARAAARELLGSAGTATAGPAAAAPGAMGTAATSTSRASDLNAWADLDGDGTSAGGGVAVAPPPRRPPQVSRPGGHGGRGPLSAGGDRRRALYFGAAAVFIAGLVLFLLFAPSARVTISLTATPVAVHPTIQGTPDSNGAQNPDHILTTVVNVSESGTFQSKPTGKKTIPAVAANAAVTFATDLPSGARFTIPKGEEFDTSANPPIRFYATADTPVCIGPNGTTPLCATPNATVPIQAGTAGAAGNVPAGAITVWPQNPCSATDGSSFCLPKDLTVNNPQPGTAGVDQQMQDVASAQDVASYTSQLSTMEQQLQQKAASDLTAKAAGRPIAVDPGGGGKTIVTGVSPSQAPQADQPYAATTVTVTVNGVAVTYAPADVHRVVVADLQGQVPQRQSLAANPQISDPSIINANTDGIVVMDLSASGYSQPTVDLNALRQQFAGKGPSSVDLQRIATRVIGTPVQRVKIAQSPFPFFVLPIFSSHIQVDVTVSGKPAS